ncbi:MAG: hypothetical protein HKP58_12865 [Desulfatitalea sp.]|nr:hypothetical protein [Desulfatitalea sp.]NNK01291.1 hypothetical protein [Desulfatitalea sp.]
MPKPSCVSLVTALLVLVLLNAPADGARKIPSEAVVYVIGSSRVTGGNMSVGREAAINAGLVTAVSQVLTELLPPETLSGKFQAVNESVLNRTDQFVTDYKVMTESAVGDNYRLMVQATISTVRLQEALKSAGIRIGDLRYPKLLVCIAEKHVQDVDPRTWWSSRTGQGDIVSAAVLEQALAEKGFTVIATDRSARDPGHNTQLDPNQARALGQRMGAEVVIVGNASAQQAANTMQGAIRSYRAGISITAWRVADGQQLAQAVDSAIKAGADADTGSREALAAATTLAGETLAEQLEQAWFQAAAGANPIDLIVHGIGGNIADFVKFRGVLDATDGVDSLQLGEMSGDTAVLAVTYQGSLRTLADTILLFNFDTFGINITQVADSAIEMQLIPK